MSKTEKITINIDVVDLGRIDLMVEQGFYSNRTDFVKTAIRNQLAVHADVVDKVITEKSYSIGVRFIDKEDLESTVQLNKKIDISHIGLLRLDPEISVDLALQAINTIKILGVFQASKELKEVLKDRIKK